MSYYNVILCWSDFGNAAYHHTLENLQMGVNVTYLFFNLLAASKSINVSFSVMSLTFAGIKEAGLTSKWRSLRNRSTALHLL